MGERAKDESGRTEAPGCDGRELELGNLVWSKCNWRISCGCNVEKDWRGQEWTWEE